MKQATLRTTSNRIRSASRTIVVILASTAAAIACGWSLITDHSVRFNSYRTGRGFYRLPPLPIMVDKKTGVHVSVMDRNESYDQGEWENPGVEAPMLSDEADDIWAQARTAIENNDVSQARNLLLKFLEFTEPPIDVTPDERARLQTKRNSAHDMLDAMSALRQGSKQQSVSDYLTARRAYDLNLEVPLDDSSGQTSTDRNLLDNWDYLRAASVLKKGDTENAFQAFSALATKYPRSEKNESALYMAAKLKMESSHSFENTSCGIQGEYWKDEPGVDPATIEASEKCRDENWVAAVDTFKQVMRKHPNGRYFDDARGWLAYLYRRGGNRAEALAEYYRMLGHPTDWAVRLEAKKSLQMLGHEYDDETLDRVEELIDDDADASMAYAYHRIYNHAVDLSYVERNPWCCSGENPWQEDHEERERVDKANKAGNHELERIARFATSMMKRHPRATVSGGFVLRVAQAQLELQNFKYALDLAQKAIRLGVGHELRAEALWIKGSSEHQQKLLLAAERTLTQLVAEYPKSKLKEGARRLLALAAEDQGNLEFALEQYIELGYDYDVGYYVDVLLTVDRLAKFVSDRPDHPMHNELLYALGVRYMRDKRWSEARTTLLRVRTQPAGTRPSWNSTSEFEPKPIWDERGSNIVASEWVMSDLKTIDTLEHMERAVENAPGDEATAEAMYQMASYLFAADDLIFYNPAAWKGTRADLLHQLHFWGNQTRLPEEGQLIFKHSQDHDTFARAIPVYLEIANRFPNARAAQDALYSAAVAHQKLSDINNYWRVAYERNLFAGPRFVTYGDVKSAYPRYQLPRGTNGWEPATRTVNGGPGWAAAPKPLPRETKEQKVKRLLHEAASTVAGYLNKMLPKVESKVDAGIDWYKSGIEAAVYGILSGIGLWAIVLVGIGLHSRRNLSDTITKVEEPVGADSRVDKFL